MELANASTRPITAKDTRKKKVIIALNSSWNLVNFRANLIRAIRDSGRDVVALAPDDGYSKQVESLGCRFVNLPMDTAGTNPVRDALLVARFFRIFTVERPICVLAYTAKPNIYGSIAARLAGVPVINNIAGLGTAYMRAGLLRTIVSRLYRIALGRTRRVFFQNLDDLRMFVEEGLVEEAATERLPGSGVDLQHFLPRPLPDRTFTTFLLISRLLWDKGVGEFVQAARIIKSRHPETRFQIVGFALPGHPAGVPSGVLDKWTASGLIEYGGGCDDVRPWVENADCIVLPSYREGVPRSLLEAAAMARPVITTDAPGCRDAIEDGVSGLLCHPRDANSLAARMEEFLQLSRADREQMGRHGRRRVEQLFDERIVINRYLEEIQAIDSTTQDGINPES